MANINGTDNNDKLAGTAQNDLINSGNGNDTIIGGAGDDQINGGSGDDVLYGGVEDSVNAGTTFGSAQFGTNEFSFQNTWVSFDTYPRQVADVNGDGYADIIGFGSNRVHVGLGKADGTFEPSKVVTSEFSVQNTWVSFNTYPRQVADVNGDGRADIIGFGSNSTFVGLGKADGTFEPGKIATSNFTTQRGWTSFDQYPRQVADVNGDGRADIIGFGANGTFVGLGRADGTFEPEKTATNEFTTQNGSWESFSKYPRYVADVNGDGRADIIGFGQNETQVALGKADGTFEPGKVATNAFSVNGGWESFNKYPRQVADVNGDGRADIIAFGQTNTEVAFGKADGTFEPGKVAYSGFTVGNGGWTGFDQYPRQVADVNGDGHADIIAFGPTGTFVALSMRDGNGNDILDGGIGNDKMFGGLGNDLYIVDSLGDVVTEAANEGTDTVSASVSYILGDNVENLILTGTGNLNGTGNALKNTLTGNAGNNLLNGKENDDTLIGALGNDIYIVNDAGDRVIEGVNEDVDVIAASVSYTLSDNVEHMGLTGTENLNATGNTLDNVLLGNSGVNTLDGAAGNDILIGARGRDTLKGGTGADKFVFTAPTDRVDRILDFSQQEQDKILLISNGFSALKAGSVKKKQFVLGNKAKDKNDRLMYNQKNGALFYDADGKGGAAQVRIATFANKPALGARDFIVGDAPVTIF